MKLFGQDFEREKLIKYFGDMYQVAGIKRYVLDDGKGRGMRAADVHTGTGFAFTVLFDRGMDIGETHFCGIPVSFYSSVGYSSPYLYEEPGMGFLRSFTGGMLTTCGLTYMGGPCIDQGEELGMHGRATAIPSEETFAHCAWENNDYVMKIGGAVRQSKLDGENMRLTRTITARAGESCMVIRDTIENCGFEAQPLMMLYHCNFGYPFVGEDSILVHSKHRTVIPKNDIAEKGLKTYDRFTSPDRDFEPQVFYHSLEPDQDGKAFASLKNQKLGLQAYIKFDTEHLPYLVQWKHLSPNGYVCGLEPSTWFGHGRDVARARNELRMLEAGQAIDIEIEIGVKKIER